MYRIVWLWTPCFQKKTPKIYISGYFYKVPRKLSSGQKKKFSPAVGLCLHCTGQLLVLFREEEKAVYSPDPPLHRQTAHPHDPAVDCS